MASIAPTESIIFQDYYQSTKDINSAANTTLLVYKDARWKKVGANTLSSKGDLEGTITKILSLNLTHITVEHLLYWIRSFNSVASLLAFKDKRKDEKIENICLTAAENNTCRFHSNNKYRWLSNFFSTIIYDPEHCILYPSVESGYVAFKARQASKSAEEIMYFAHLTDPGQVKREGADLWSRETEAHNEIAIKEMQRLVTLKFQQNPFIAQWLKASTARLEEFTSDSFWGTARGTQINENSNHLGKILTKVREHLNSVSVDTDERKSFAKQSIGKKGRKKATIAHST